MHPAAGVPESCIIGPYCVVGEHVVLGDDCELISHVVLDGHSHFGDHNRVFSFAALGVAPQDLKYKNEPTRLEVGDGNIFREGVTVSRGTAGGGGLTRIGSNCLIMAYAHVGHDSVIGESCILANAATLAGHVIVEDFATIGALNQVHQYCRIGKYAYTGGGTTVTQDVLPYSLTSAKRETHAFGLNKIGLERRGFTKEQLRSLYRAFRMLTASKLNTSQALAQIKDAAKDDEHLAYLASFISVSERGVIK